MSVESRVIRYLKENPGATPRLIADALGLSISQVRLALSKLRDSGYVVRIPGEGYYVRASIDSRDLEVAEADYGLKSRKEEGGNLTQLIERIRETVDGLASRVDRLEKEVKEVRLVLEALTKANQEAKLRPSATSEVREDPVVKELKNRKIMKVSEVLAIATKPLE
ncbi:MAG: winged helix-turn-helix transcriptional regulator, partial [Sulfolobales archaeon]|nr:winged helix-turn-helix transcriptional regulator [Sulfolobales archaeon]